MKFEFGNEGLLSIYWHNASKSWSFKLNSNTLKNEQQAHLPSHCKTMVPDRHGSPYPCRLPDRRSVPQCLGFPTFYGDPHHISHLGSGVIHPDYFQDRSSYRTSTDDGTVIRGHQENFKARFAQPGTARFLFILLD